MSHNLFPLFIDLHGRHVVIYGGGAIATRRAETLSQFGPRLTVIAPVFSPGLQQLDCACICARFDPAAVPRADCVLACTDDESVNREIAAVCRARGIPVNNASDQADCDFHFPAVAISPPLVVGINAGGQDHGLVKRTAEKIRALLENLE